MAINNINALVDLEGLEQLQSSDYVSKYYNAGLANLGQRYTNEALLEYNNFTINDLLSFRYNTNYDSKSYLVIYQKNENAEFSIDENIGFKIAVPNELGKYSNFVDLNGNGNKFDEVSNTNFETIIFSKKLWIIKKLYEKVIFDIAYDPKNKSEYLASINDSNYHHDNIYGDERYGIYNQLQLWIPISYPFEYVSDGLNKSIIYGDHKNIFVYIEPNENDDPSSIAENPIKNGTIFVQYARKYEKTCVYNYSFTKDSEIPTITRGFVLPFVDNENYWWINNIPTDISAKADTPMNLNIILAYLQKVGNSNNFQILSGLNYNLGKLLEIDNLSKHTVWIKKNNGGSFWIDCFVPNINKVSDVLLDYDQETKADIVNILKNSSIILMTKLSKYLDNLDEDLKKQYNDGIITTIWTYDNESNGYKYISLEKDDQNNDLALDFGEITNFNNLISYKVNSLEQIRPDNFTNRHIIFDQILKSNKQEISNNVSYAVLKNIKGLEYHNKYVNNFNFTLRYVNSIQLSKDNKYIESISNQDNEKYFKVQKTESSSLVTNSIYQRTINNRTIYYPEYIPNYNVPVFDMSEFLIKDSNVMNRQNIISFTDSGLSYYSYIGTSHDSLNKSILHIGTSDFDINLGEYSLTSDIDKTNFQKHDGIGIDFDNIYLNGNTVIQEELNVGKNVYFEKINWNKTSMENLEIQSTQIIPKFKYISNNNGSIYHDINIDSMISRLNEINSGIKSSKKYNFEDETYSSKYYLYLNIILSHKIKNVDYYYKYNDLLYIDNLIRYLDIEKPENIISNTNKIIYNSSNDAIFMVSSNNLLADSINIVASSDTQISITVKNIQDIYIGNPLDITYIKNTKNGSTTLIINEHQSHKIKSIWKLPEQI